MSQFRESVGVYLSDFFGGVHSNDVPEKLTIVEGLVVNTEREQFNVYRRLLEHLDLAECLFEFFSIPIRRVILGSKDEYSLTAFSILAFRLAEDVVADPESL